MTYAEAQKALQEGWIWGREATDAYRARARETLAKMATAQAPEPINAGDWL